MSNLKTCWLLSGAIALSVESKIVLDLKIENTAEKFLIQRSKTEFARVYFVFIYIACSKLGLENVCLCFLTTEAQGGKSLCSISILTLLY